MIGIDVQGFIAWLTRVGLPGAVIFFVVGLHQGWWVLGRELEAAVKDRDEWKTRALTAMRLSDRAVATAEEVTTTP